MKEFLLLLGDYWWLLVSGLFLGILAYYVPFVRNGLLKIWSTVNKEKLIIQVTMFLFGQLVKSTKNQLDDGWYNQAAKKLGAPTLPPQKKDTKEAK